MEENSEQERNVTLTVTCSSFPLRLFKEWDEDCVTRFGNCRWMKMWHDHLAAKQLETFTILMNKLEELEFRIRKLEERSPKRKALTLGEKKEEEVKSNEKVTRSEV